MSEVSRTTKNNHSFIIFRDFKFSKKKSIYYHIAQIPMIKVKIACVEKISDQLRIPVMGNMC